MQASSSSSSPLQSDSNSSLPPQRNVPKDIPGEIIFDILTWLPVQSLLRFKCVSKSWLSLISDSKFIKAHLLKSSNNNHYTHHRLILHKVYSNSCMRQCSLHSALYAPTTEATNISFVPKAVGQFLQIVGSCNGLICGFYVDKQVVLWNPATKKAKRLPDFGSHCFVTYGFGYDQLNDDYKVVGIAVVSPRKSVVEPLAKVYSLKTDCWRVVEDSKGCRNIEKAYPTLGKLANGKLHWPAETSSALEILSIDLSDERYGQVREPHFEEVITAWTLEVLGGCLSLFYNVITDVGARVDVWIMKEYGVPDSWTKLVSIPDVYCPGRDALCRPLFLSKDGKVLFQFRREAMALYDIDKKSLTYPEITNSGSLQGVDVYVESLVLPDLTVG